MVTLLTKAFFYKLLLITF